MNELLLAYLLVSVFFFVLLFFKKFLTKKIKNKFCVICASFVLTWASLLTLYWNKAFENIILIALLIGMSVLGIYYAVENKVKEEIKLFRFPFILTLISLGYFILTFEFNIDNLIFLFVLWILFLFVFIYHKNKSVKIFINNIVECCKKW